MCLIFISLSILDLVERRKEMTCEKEQKEIGIDLASLLRVQDVRI